MFVHFLHISVILLKREFYKTSRNTAKGTARTTTDIWRHAPCEILPPTHTLPKLSEAMMDHNLMGILNKHCYTHSNLWYLMLRTVDCAEKAGKEECKICTLTCSAL